MIKRIYFIIISLIIIFTSCNHKEKNNTVENISKDETVLLQIYQKADSLYNIGIINDELFIQFIDTTLNFSKKYPESSITPTMLSRAGVACMTLAKKISSKEELDNKDKADVKKFAEQGIGIFDRIIEIYPDFENIGTCYINKAIIYDDILHEYQNAEFEYREFISKFPNDTMSESIRYYLRYLGKSPDSIMNAIDSKNNKK